LATDFQREWPSQQPLQELIGAVGGHQVLPMIHTKPAKQALWLIPVSPALPMSQPTEPPPGWTPGDYACGIILCWQPDRKTPDHELFVWIRGAYRSQEIGRKSIDVPLKQIEDELRHLALTNKAPQKLRVPYPASDLYGKGGSLTRSMLLRFYYQYGFHRVASAEGELVMEKTLEACDQGSA
jgi:hypothetical protein